MVWTSRRVTKYLFSKSTATFFNSTHEKKESKNETMEGVNFSKFSNSNGNAFTQFFPLLLPLHVFYESVKLLFYESEIT